MNKFLFYDLSPFKNLSESICSYEYLFSTFLHSFTFLYSTIPASIHTTAPIITITAAAARLSDRATENENKCTVVMIKLKNNLVINSKLNPFQAIILFLYPLQK